MQTEVIAFATKDNKDVQSTQKALDIEFVLVPGPNVKIMKQYKAYNRAKGRAKAVTLIIDKLGILRWKYVGKDLYDRPNGAKILDQLSLLK